MGWSWLADAVVVVHFACTLLIIFGGFLAWRHRWVLFVHPLALAWGAWVELSSQICPLTPLENHLRERAGETGYTGGFLAHYLGQVLYPPGLTREMQWALAALLIAINVIAYAGTWRRWRAASDAREPSRP
jgi:hypothetical protein